MDSDDLFPDTYTVNIDKCIKDKSTPSVIRMMFQTLREQTYINPGNFFQEMSDGDLELLLDCADDSSMDAEDVSEERQMQATQAMILLGIGLAMGEGSLLDEDSIFRAAQAANVYVSIESLHRKGLVKALHENWTILEQSDKPIVMKLDE